MSRFARQEQIIGAKAQQALALTIRFGEPVIQRIGLQGRFQNRLDLLPIRKADLDEAHQDSSLSAFSRRAIRLDVSHRAPPMA